MGKLRDKMIQEMILGDYSKSTISLYTKAVQDFVHFFGVSPLELSPSQIRDYFLHLHSHGCSSCRLHIAYSAVKYFYKINELPYILDKMPRPKRPFVIPAVLSQTEVETLLSASRTLRYKTVFSLIYSAGLRVSEALNIALCDIDIQRKMIHIRNAKGSFDRFAILSDKMIPLLLRYINRYKPRQLLFFSRKDPNRKLAVRYLQTVFQEQAKSAGIEKRIRIHTLRHSFATHLLENNTNLFYIMKLLGHRSIRSTMVYLHMQRLDKLDLKSPLDIYDISLDKHHERFQPELALSIA